MGEEENSSHQETPSQLQTPPENSTGKSILLQGINLISCLIPLSYSIRVFSVKWQSIRGKLEELLAGLDAIEKCEFLTDPTLLSSIQAIITTLHGCDDLARRCSDMSYGGKLLMQSDLDIVSSRLDNHVKSLSDIYALFLEKQSSAIVVSRPSFSASRDDIRFYIRDLFSRLKIGSTDMKREALIAFSEAIQEDDKYVKIALEFENFVAILVSFLDSDDVGIQEEAGKIVSLILGIDSCRNELVGAGGIGGLIRALENGSDLSRECAGRCLMKLTENSDNSWSVSAHGGVTALMKICSNCGSNSNGELVSLACGVLRNLAGVLEIKRFMVEEGAISMLVKLVKSKEEAALISSIEFLQAMACGDESVREMIMEEDAIRALVRVLDPKSSFSSKAREMSLRGIMNLCHLLDDSLSIVLNCAFMDHLLYFLRFGEISMQEMALKAAFWLCGESGEAKKAMGDAGFMVEIIKFLDSKLLEVQEMAAKMLSMMLMVPRNRKRFLQNDQNVGLILQNLDSEEATSGNNKVLLSILLSLTSSNSGRKKIVSSVYLKNIEMLAEAEVSDAKKIIRKLSSNRFRSILTAFWHS